MKTFPTAFAAQKNLLTGASPVWIFKFTAGGVDYYLSDNAFAVAPLGITTLKWVKSWGQLQEGISGTLDEFRISDFNLDVLIDPDASPNMEALAVGFVLEQSPVSLYLWFYGCTDPPQEMFRGYIKDLAIPDETLVQPTIQDESLRLERAMIGNKVTLATYPSADPDDVGKVVPIVFGTLSKFPALAIDAGIQTSLPANITAVATSFAVSDPSGLSVGMQVWVDQEKMTISGIAGSAITVTRAMSGSLAQPHGKATILWQDKSEFVYIVADHILASILKVYAKVGQALLDITAICTRYPAGTHGTYPGKAVVSVPGYVTAAQAVALVPDASTFTVSLDGVTVASLLQLVDPGHNHGLAADSTELPGNPVIPTGYPASTAVSYVNGSWGIWGSGNVTGLYLQFPAHGARNYTNYTITLNFNQTSLGVRFYMVVSGVIKYYQALNIVSGSPFTFPIFSGGTAVDEYLYVMSPDIDSNHFKVTAASRVINLSTTSTGSGSTGNSLTPTATIGYGVKGGAIALSGNSVANTLVGDQILCDIVALNTSIPAVYGQLLALANYPGTFQQTGTWPSCYSYNGAITDYQSALYWLNELAFQSRAWFKLSRGLAQLIYRPDALTSVKTLATCRISGGKRVHSRKKTIYDEILNTINVMYSRDWAQTKGATAYTALAAGSDPVSIANFGDRERADLFMLDFVTDPTMAANLLAFYLSWYAVRHWLHEFDTFLYDAELEFGDGVTLGFIGNLVGQILETKLTPGSSTKSDTIDMVVVV